MANHNQKAQGINSSVKSITFRSVKGDTPQDKTALESLLKNFGFKEISSYTWRL